MTRRNAVIAVDARQDVEQASAMARSCGATRLDPHTCRGMPASTIAA